MSDDLVSESSFLFSIIFFFFSNTLFNICFSALTFCSNRKLENRIKIYEGFNNAIKIQHILIQPLRKTFLEIFRTIDIPSCGKYFYLRNFFESNKLYWQKEFSPLISSSLLLSLTFLFTAFLLTLSEISLGSYETYEALNS